MLDSAVSRFLVALVCALLLSPVATGAGPATPPVDEVERIIRESEYHVTWQDQTVLPDLDAAWHAVNRAQNLRFYFTDDGLRVVNRTADGNPQLLRLAVANAPANDSGPTTLEVTDSRLEISRPGITESFVNDQTGLHHILTISDAPLGGGPFVVELEWSATGIFVSDHAIEFQTPSGRRLVYSIEEGVDGSGAPMRLAPSANGDCIRLAVLGSNPVYPIIIKNLLSSAANTVLERNVAFDRLGTSAATGDLNGDGFADVVVAANAWNDGQLYEGAILVFYGKPGGIPSNGTGSIATAADVVIQSDVAGLLWPDSLAIVGDVNGDGYDDLVAGGVYWQPSPAPPIEKWGALWVFEGSASGITATTSTDADALITSNVNDAMFGAKVSAAGDVNGDGFADVIAIAPKWDDDPTQVSEGAAFVFHGGPTGITASSITEADAVIEGNEIVVYGGSWAAGLGDINGDGYDDVAVGMFGLDHPESGEGGIAIFYGGAIGIASNPTQAMADAADTLIEGNLAGLALVHVAGTGDVNGDGFDDVIIGGPYWEDLPANQNEGMVAVFHGGASGIPSNGTTPLADAADTVIEGNPSPHVTLEFGRGISGAGDYNGDGFADVVAGAPNFTNGETDEGALFVFFGSASGISSSRTDPVEDVADIVIEGNMASLMFGSIGPDAGDVNGDGYSDMVVPAENYSSPETQEGAVLIYHGGANLPQTEADAFGLGAHNDFYLGSSVASAGDVNGDGFVDLAVGAPSSVGVGSNPPGMVFVFHGSPDPDLSPTDWSATGDNTNEDYGKAVSAAGDVNGDGFGDLVVGVPRYTNGEIDEGRAEVFLGSASGLAADPDWTFESNVAGALFGYDVASAGDVDGDGYGDVIVGAPNYGDGQTDEGRAYVFFGSSSGLEVTPGWTFESDLADAWLGASVGGAGDVDGDGFADIVVGAPYFESGETDEGAAYGFMGAADGLPSVPNWFIQTNRAGALYGIDVAGAGDVNADGYSDVIVGATWDSNPEHHEGRVYIYHGAIAGLSTTANVVLETNRADGGFGLSVDTAGDLNGDGYSDVIVGANKDSGALGEEGRAYVFLGSGAGVAGQAAWFAEGNYQYDEFGTSVAGLGDHNGDGFSDLVIGAPFALGAAVHGGLVELYLGNSGAGRLVVARQLRGGGDSTPVQPWGLAHDGDEYQVSMTATSPRGRELAKLHVEACPPGEVWGDVDCRHVVSSDWTAIPLGEQGVTIVETVAGLTDSELYRWRAHVLYLPLHANEPGITEPPVPRHGPWRTLFALAPAADIRVGEPQQITIEMVSTSSSVGEGVPQAEVNIVMTTSDGEVSEVDSSVDFTTWDGSALAGQDFVHTSFNRFFPAGTINGAAQSITVNLINDDLDEPEEDFVVEITNPLGAVLGPQTIHMVTILDDDPPPELSVVDVVVNEGAGLAVVVLELGEATSFEVTVDYGSVDGSAVAPLDYSPVSGTATIPPMDTIFNIDIPIEEDWLEEGDETFTLDLSSPSNATLVTSTVLVTIVDNDAGILFADGFESGGSGGWSGVTP